jgi:imidazole glycerol-phosphate synthase subunit HisH
MKVIVFDYGAGNLHSLAKAVALSGAEVVIEPDATKLTGGDVLVLPGVGAFDPAAERLAPGREAVRAALDGGLPCLGICLGMQLLFDASEESSNGAPGIGLIPGRVTRLAAQRVPQIGWNSLDDADDPLLTQAGLGTAYYANSYVCRPVADDVVRAWSSHEGDRYPAVVRQGRTVGVQFHPEKSSREGVAFVRAFVEEAAQ